MKNIRCLNLLDGYIWWIWAKKKKNEHEMAREQRGSYVCVCVYIYIIYNGTTREKNRKKQETDYNKILVGARTRDRIQTKEMMRNSRLNGSNLLLLLLFFFLNLISKYLIPARLCYTLHDWPWC